ncbi:MAG: hypothetical protein HZB99_00395 [Candidatus Harrisonbacteria bacterium]|nr:hypothetical protein [Candidatus Harrisonbacteria bacterium]
MRRDVMDALREDLKELVRLNADVLAEAYSRPYSEWPDEVILTDKNGKKWVLKKLK